MNKVIPIGRGMRLERDVERTIRDLANDSGRVFVTRHAKERMLERRVTRPQILECLRKGRITEPLHQEASGSWIGTFSRTVAGQDVDVVAKLQEKSDGEFVLVITVITP
ncbi:MAG: DUF4258 domain-containing protein [Proteobacteria bacterium]|nr:DUF4258 domain-containing protein [Pseudomonadota bacterium]MCL2308482.1 DUF4258 domain-containing protein [Pseudomonadota bacterium]